MKKAYLIATVITVAVIVALAYYAYSSNLLPFAPVNTPSVSANPSPTLSPSPTPYPHTKTPPTYFTELSQYEINANQGEAFQINVTISYYLNETTTFTPQIQLAGYGNAAWDSSKDSHTVYNATFSQENLVLKPQDKASTLLTISIALDAPIGRYLFYVGNTALTVNVASFSSLAQATVSNIGYLGSSKIYLMSANSSFSQYSGPEVTSPGFVEVHAGDPCFKITVILRNDYTTENPIPDSKYSNNTEYATFMVSAYLYDKNGSSITAPDVTDQHWMPINIPQHGIGYGKTSTYDIVLLTSRQDIDHYEIRFLGTIIDADALIPSR